MEFIIGNLIKAHPMALVHPERVQDPEALQRIQRTDRGFADRANTSSTHSPRASPGWPPPPPGPAIVRLSDFKSNEYAHLLGGGGFERAEENPMLGFRGASRYYVERYREGFALECRALRGCASDIGFTNVIVMVPFCRTTGEADQVLEVMAAHGLQRGENSLQVYVMCEIPSNVILAEEFAKRFDGFSIGSNDLTQLVLGVDRDAPTCRRCSTSATRRSRA